MINSTLNLKKEMLEQKYPYIGVTDTYTVLFTAKQTGTCIHSNGCHHIGYYSTCWSVSEFKELKGNVTLKNED